MIKVSDDPLRLDGTLLIQTSGFSIVALGSYANLGGQPSFFLFGVLLGRLGGDPAFFVTGIALGVGINRQLRLPDLNGVRTYPLVRAACDKDYLGPQLDLRMVSQKLTEFIKPSLGDYWIAAGIRFDTYGMLDSFVLLTVAFGTRLEIGVLGLSIFKLPKELPGATLPANIPVIAYAELAIRVAITPEAGLVAVEAKLTENSYLLIKECKLTGGFAFYVWFGSNTYRGDFVLTLGGYHPRFKVPSHYPKPERVGIRCRLPEFGIDIQGGMYFALTPAAIMAGGGLSIVFDKGWVKAWFIVQADFLIQWKPFHYDIEVGVSIGVALILDMGLLAISVKLQLSAHVLLAGPPLGGYAQVTWWIITVTIRFGAQPDPRELESDGDAALPEGQGMPAGIPARRSQVDWDHAEPDKSFVKSFLGVAAGKEKKALLQLDVAEGLLSETKNTDGEVTDRLVRAHGLVVTTNSLIPARAVKVNDIDLLKGKKQPVFGVRPLKQATLDSQLAVTVKPVGRGLTGPAGVESLLPAVIERRLPSALWGTDKLDPRKPPKPDALTDMLPTGVRLKLRPADPDHCLPVMDLELLKTEDYLCKKCNWGAVPPTQTIAGQKKSVTISSTIMDQKVAALRQGVIDELVKLDELARVDEAHGSRSWASPRISTCPPANQPPGK